MIREVAVVVSVLCASTSAFADEAAARKLFASGESAYNLADFDKAVALFKQAYEQWPEAAFLFNIAQTYRQLGNCKQSLFFYKRFLSLKEQDTKKPLRVELRTEVEKRIVELEECIKRELAAKPPTQLESGTSTTTTETSKPNTTVADTTTNTTDEPEPEEEPEEEITKSTTQPSVMSVRGAGGAAKLSVGELDTFRFAAALVGGYPLSLSDELQLELGAGLSFTPLPYTTTMDEKGSVGLIGIVANVAPSYSITPQIAARVDAGVGVLVISGLGKEGNPFTEGGAPATGALSTLHVRFGISGDFAVTRNIIITATPLAFSYSPAPTGFLSTITSLTTLSFMAGVGYRM